MKKIILLFVVFTIVFTVYSNEKRKEEVKIPDSAIRFRILANSNSLKDQKIKKNVKDSMQKQLYLLLKDAKTKQQAKKLILNNMDDFSNTVEKELINEEYSYKIDYGMHDFPQKTYKGITYEAGKYESLLVTLGKGEGNNWWCVLFPPFCTLETEETQTKDIEYRSLIKDIIKNILNNK